MSRRLATLLASTIAAARPAVADDPPVPPEGHHHIVLGKGDQAPSDGVFADTAMAKYDFERLRYYEVFIKQCQEVKTEKASYWPWIAGGAGGLVVGIIAGVVLHQRYEVTK